MKKLLVFLIVVGLVGCVENEGYTLDERDFSECYVTIEKTFIVIEPIIEETRNPLIVVELPDGLATEEMELRTECWEVQ